MWSSERTKVRHNQECEKNEVFLDRAHQPHHRRPMDIAFELLLPTDVEN